ncbi:MAG: type II toxin-antitoxin system Phd/YefM family antitoxin [Thiolinea sp.]
MQTYTFSEARQNFAAVLDKAQKDGTVRIRRRDGRVFILTPAPVQKSPLDIKGIQLNIQRDELVDLVKVGRERDYLN